MKALARGAAVCLLLASCTTGGPVDPTTGAATTPSTASGQAAPSAPLDPREEPSLEDPDGEQAHRDVLAKPAAVIRTEVTRAVTAASAASFEFSDPTGDEWVPCDPDQDWPARWNYSVRLAFDDDDSTPHLLRAQRALESVGWHAEPPQHHDAEYDVTFYRAGYVLSLTGGTGRVDGTSRLDIVGSTPCSSHAGDTEGTT